MTTNRLYWNNSYDVEFAAVIENIIDNEARAFVVLDQTAFYPEGGGQPSDAGWINGLRVENVLMDDDGSILHEVASLPELKIGEKVNCKVDWTRRQEMIQQHTGQHILSQAFFQLFGAETRGFRITDHSTEIDIQLEANPDEIERAILRAEDLANSIVFENRQIRIHEVTPEQAATLPLRKESFITDCIRVIEIEDYDWSPCGGTHAKRTGEVGLIAVRSWERAKKMTRIQFLCGVRALRDYRMANKTADSIALRLTVGRNEAENSVVKLLDENKRLSRRVRDLVEIAAKIEGQEILASVGLSNGIRIVLRTFDDRDFEETKLLAHRLVDGSDVVALLAAREPAMARLVFARSANLAVDVNALMKIACEKLGGRGGGKPDFAQGGGTNLNELEQVLKETATSLIGR